MMSEKPRNTWNKLTGDPIPKDEVDKKLELITASMMASLISFETEHQEEFGTSSGIVGILIFGSWAKRIPNTKSDIDIYVITTEDTVNLWMEFAEQLRSRDVQGVQAQAQLNINNKSSLQAGILAEDSLLGEAPFIVVSPHEWVSKKMFEIIGRNGAL